MDDSKKSKTGSGSSQENYEDVKAWKSLLKKLGKDRELKKILSDMGILDEGDDELSAAETLHRVLDAIKAGKISSSHWERLPDYESCSSSEDEEEEDREFANVGKPTQQYVVRRDRRCAQQPIAQLRKEVVSLALCFPKLTTRYDYDARSVTRVIQGVPETYDTAFDPEDPLQWAERNGMGRILVTPVPEFFEMYFENKPLHECIKGKGAEGRFSDLLSEDLIFDLMTDKRLRYGQDVDVTVVGKDGVRQTLNGEGFVDPAEVKSQFLQDGCSVRLLHPQRFSDPLWSLMYKLECFWGSCVGCNAYLTPKGSHQGFAPHFDDIDAFVVQVSGKKKWRLYRSPDNSLVLPRYSSRDFESGELGKPFWKGTLSAGDVLYLPRGMIHDAVSVAGCNSLHITISMNQRNNYFEFLTSLFSSALESCARDQVAFRRTMPVRYLLPDDAANEPLAFEKKIDRLMESAFMRVSKPATICRAFSDFMLNRLPPPPDTRRFPQEWSTDVKVNAGMSVSLTFPLSAYAELDVSGKEPALFVYHCLSNSRDLHQTLDADADADHERVEPQLEVPLDCGPALHALLSGKILSLSGDDMASKSLRVIDLAQALLDAGILSVVRGQEPNGKGSIPSRKRRSLE